jgi:hypothetical protein
MVVVYDVWGPLVIETGFSKATVDQPNMLSTFLLQLFYSSFCKSHNSQQLLQKPQLN